MIDAPDEEILATGVQGPLRLDDALFVAPKANKIAPLQIVRADRVFGMDHLRSAAMHATRAFAEGRNHADRWEVECTRYLAGERQIKKALAKVGLPETSDAVVVFAHGPKRQDALQYFLHALGLKADDTLLDGSAADLSGFGVTDEQMAATTAGLETDIVLEMVAAVDLMRK